jgi:hypothetical protein
MESKRPSLFFLAPLSPLDFFTFSLPFSLSPLARLPRATPFHNGLLRRHPRSLERDRRQARGARTRRRRQGRAQAGEVMFFPCFFWLALVSSSINWTSKSQKPLRASRLGLVFPDELT